MTTPATYAADDAVMLRQGLLPLLNGLREHVDRLAFIMHTVWDLNPRTVLDLACHFGLIGSLIQWGHSGQAPRSVIGVDWSPEAVAFTRALGTYAAVFQADLVTPISSLTPCELVLCLEVLEHVADPPAVIANAFAHCASGGHVLFSVPRETEPVDGTFHVRHVTAEQLEDWIAPHTFTFTTTFLPSAFCEKPRWAGWTFCLATRM